MDDVENPAVSYAQPPTGPASQRLGCRRTRVLRQQRNGAPDALRGCGRREAVLLNAMFAMAGDAAAAAAHLADADTGLPAPCGDLPAMVTALAAVTLAGAQGDDDHAAELLRGRRPLLTTSPNGTYSGGGQACVGWLSLRWSRMGCQRAVRWWWRRR